MTHYATWAITAAATAGVIVRPFGWPEWIWAVAGAVLLIAAGLLSPAQAGVGVVRGTDVYLFLTGMMVLSEVARQEGLFDWLAAYAVRAAQGSATRLFTLVFIVGICVTVFLSNDATAVVLTPAVAAAAKTARVPDRLPYLLICAFVANAASFVLPISNPANLVIYGGQMPPLLEWLPRFALPSAVSIGVTYALLRWTQRAALRGPVATDFPVPPLPAAGVMAAAGIGLTGVVLLVASARGSGLGWPTFGAGVVTALLVLTRSQSGPLRVLRGVSWGVLPLVAGLFVLVEALEVTGVVQTSADWLRLAVARSADNAFWGVGAGVAMLCNLLNNLPAGLVAGRVVALADVPDKIRTAVLIGIDLGPNLSITGSLATILWLVALRREGMEVGARAFLKLGAIVMPPALLLALAAV